MSIIIYRDANAVKNNSWIRYFNQRIRQNKNNLITVTGATGSGKTWTAIAICEMMSEFNGVPFTIDNIIFSLKDLMSLINSGKLKKGSCIIFDEPQVTISNRSFQSLANKVFNHLLTTFRHRNLTLFFCTPYEDLLDKTARKLFHAKFTTIKINKNTQTVKVKPVCTEYNAHYEKFYEKFLRVAYKRKEGGKYAVRKLKKWDVRKPSKEIIEVYEKKKRAFTDQLNEKIERQLIDFEKKELGLDKRKELTEKQARALDLMSLHHDTQIVADKMKIKRRAVQKHLELAKKKGYLPQTLEELRKIPIPNVITQNIGNPEIKLSDGSDEKK